MSSIVYRTFHVGVGTDTVQNKTRDFLTGNGFVRVDSTGGAEAYRYPGVTFSSKKPLTCISRLFVEFAGAENGTAVRVGVTFTKIRFFTIGVMALICFVLPAVLGHYQHGMVVIPPMSWLGIPLGFMLHFHVRWRVFTRLARFFAGLSEADRV